MIPTGPVSLKPLVKPESPSEPPQDRSAQTLPKRYYLGVDPGAYGGWSLVDGQLNLIAVGHLPRIEKATTSLKVDGALLQSQWLMINDCYTIAHAFVEAVNSRPRQAGAFQFGVNTGTIHGLCYGLGIPLTLVGPTAWKGFAKIKRYDDDSKRDVKSEARQRCMTWFPDQAHLFRRNMDDAVAEATLIALYGVSKLRGR